ncbi:hypothetical protein CSC73_01460 [Pseudoxanthomonas sacheonensis]|nr:hypothetical protein CSC73_01460 [Pseudoxanthomonas sacheonensis]
MREQLHALPEIPLPDALWRRVDAKRRQKLQRRKLGAGIATLALAAVMAAPLLAPMFAGAGRTPGERIAARPSMQHDAQAELRALDHALQAAYDRGASDAEIAPMWVARDALLVGLQSGNSAFRRNRI